MSRRAFRLPPLASLRGFEAAARLGSFSKAAEELNMTQSAISHQIRALEAYFEQPLFRRAKRSVELTDAGADFMQTVAKSLDLLSDGVNRLAFYRKPGSVIVASEGGFASKWLVPRLPRLRYAYPQVEPWIFPAAQVMDLYRAEVDFVISYGNGEWPEFEVERLLSDSVTPVCAPSLAPEGRLSWESLKSLPLIHDERREDWQAWFNAAGLAGADTISGLNFGDFGLSLDAALAGQGVVLGSIALTRNLVESNLLMRPFELAIETSDSYYLVYLRKHLNRPAARQFYDWLKMETAIERAP